MVKSKMSGGGSGTSRSTRDLICHAGAGAAAGLLIRFQAQFRAFFCCASMKLCAGVWNLGV